MGKHIFTEETISAGQPKPYNDSIYESILTFNTEGYGYGWTPNKEMVLKYAKIFVRDYADKPEWYQARLKSIEQLNKNSWKVIIIEPYLD